MRKNLSAISRAFSKSVVLLLGITFAFTAGCSTSPTSLADEVGHAHGQAAWDKNNAVECDIEVNFGGNTILAGRMLYAMHSGQVRIDLADGGLMLFDGERAWVANGADATRARFHLLTWPYFVAAPFKIDDPGTNLNYEGWQRVGNQHSRLAKLSFDPGVGDTPDDWYLLYINPDTYKLLAMAYIVTYGKSVEDANDSPSSIAYHDYAWIDGALISQRWTFHKWSPELGLHGAPKGGATISNVAFVEPASDAFVVPDGAEESKLP